MKRRPVQGPPRENNKNTFNRKKRSVKRGGSQEKKGGELKAKKQNPTNFQPSKDPERN